jgi:hypothetical protein
MTAIACFISPHGFGHAARAAALMEAMAMAEPTLRFEIFTTVPDWFFQDSLSAPFRYHPLKTDVGFVQTSPLHEDLDATLAALDRFLPFDDDLTSDLARFLSGLGCRSVVCDIAPLGIAVAAKAQIPSVLVENFTWDRLYAGYPQWNGGFQRHIDYLERMFGRADLHIQAEPICRRTASDLAVPPMSRKVRTSGAAVRRSLLIEDDAPMVVLTMGGIEERYRFLEQLRERSDVRFIIPGGAPETIREGNLLLLPQRSWIYHPDLINACDALVGKAGYSTIAEAHQAGVPFGYIPRPGFPEMPGLIGFIRRRMPAMAISPETYDSGAWIHRIDTLLSMAKNEECRPNGVDQAGAFILERVL